MSTQTQQPTAQDLINAFRDNKPTPKKHGVGDVYRSASNAVVSVFNILDDLSIAASTSSSELLKDLMLESANADVARAKELTNLDMTPSEASQFMSLWLSHKKAEH